MRIFACIRKTQLCLTNTPKTNNADNTLNIRIHFWGKVPIEFTKFSFTTNKIVCISVGAVPSIRPKFCCILQTPLAFLVIRF